MVPTVGRERASLVSGALFRGVFWGVGAVNSDDLPPLCWHLSAFIIQWSLISSPKLLPAAGRVVMGNVVHVPHSGPAKDAIPTLTKWGRCSPSLAD